MADKDKASGRVWRSRLRALDSLQISVDVLKKECIRLEKKIEEEGLEGRYSINSDIMRWARRAHSCCYELSILYVVQEQIVDKQEDMPRPDSALRQRLESIALVFAGLALGFLLFGFP